MLSASFQFPITVSNFKAFWLLNVDICVDWGVQVGSHHVKLFDLTSRLSSKV